MNDFQKTILSLHNHKRGGMYLVGFVFVFLLAALVLCTGAVYFVTRDAFLLVPFILFLIFTSAILGISLVLRKYLSNARISQLSQIVRKIKEENFLHDQKLLASYEMRPIMHKIGPSGYWFSEDYFVSYKYKSGLFYFIPLKSLKNIEIVLLGPLTAVKAQYTDIYGNNFYEHIQTLQLAKGLVAKMDQVFDEVVGKLQQSVQI